MGSYLAIGEFLPRIVPTRIGGEGIRWIFIVRNKKETHENVYETSRITVYVENPTHRTPCTSIAKTVQKKVVGGNK